METQDFEKELEKLGKRIKQIRKHRKLTLLDLETLSGINDSDLSRYEQGKENLELLTLFKIANALEVAICTLTDYEGGLPDNSNFKGLGKRKKTVAPKASHTSKRNSLKK